MAVRNSALAWGAVFGGVLGPVATSRATPPATRTITASATPRATRLVRRRPPLGLSAVVGATVLAHGWGAPPTPAPGIPGGPPTAPE